VTAAAAAVARTGPRDAGGWEILAGLRFVLALIVACGHLFRFAPADGVLDRALIRIGAFDAVAAVFCFLVISGFSIAHSITRSPDGYIRRRVLRIYPLYLAGLGAALLPFLFAGPRIETINSVFTWPDTTDLLGNLVLLQGFVVPPVAANGPLWTLAVEVFCYLLAPLLIRLPMAGLLAATAASALAFAAFPWLHLGFYSTLSHGLPALFLVWAWLAGFVFFLRRHDARYQVALICLGALLFSINTTFNMRLAVFTYVATAALVVHCDRLELPAAARRLAAYLGELSYPLYVIHVPVFLFAHAVLGLRSAAALLALAFLAAAALYHGIDKPLRRPGLAARLPVSP